MAVKMKRSSVAGKVPTTAQLELGELAVNTYDGRLFLKRDDGTEAIVELVNDNIGVASGVGLLGGGKLTQNRMIWADIASQAEAEAGTVSTKLMTPERVAQAIAALAPSPAAPTFESIEKSFVANSRITVQHGLSRVPYLYQVRLRCKVANLGYSVGDEIPITNMVDGDGARGYVSWANSTEINFFCRYYEHTEHNSRLCRHHCKPLASGILRMVSL